ncbi:MAG: carboxypeptidase-like regulatory domain-containing protein [Terracidiphilus sp.]
MGLVALIGTANGQYTQHKAASPLMGSLSGRVFAITKSGDLKPARMADVYILYSSGVARDGKSVDVGETPELVFLKEQNHAQALYVGEIGKNTQWSEKETCMHDLATFRPSMIKALGWVVDHKKKNQIVTTQTDEDGNFAAPLPVGKYHVYVRGRAGFNESLWDTDLDYVSIQPGAHVVLKLSSPSTSCLDVPERESVE